MGDANRRWKRTFYYSRLVMLLVHNYSGRRILGYSYVDENPVYGYIRYENRPRDVETLRRNLQDADRLGRGWRSNLQAEVDVSRRVGATVILVEMPFLPEAYASGALPLRRFDESQRPQALEALDRRMKERNAILRDVADSAHVAFVDTDDLVDPEYLLDDCHFNADGERRLALRLAEYVEAERPFF